jgi:hypothetical protein
LVWRENSGAEVQVDQAQSLDGTIGGVAVRIEPSEHQIAYGGLESLKKACIYHQQDALSLPEILYVVERCLQLRKEHSSTCDCVSE